MSSERDSLKQKTCRKIKENKYKCGAAAPEMKNFNHDIKKTSSTQKSNKDFILKCHIKYCEHGKFTKIETVMYNEDIYFSSLFFLYKKFSCNKNNNFDYIQVLQKKNK